MSDDYKRGYASGYQKGRKTGEQRGREAARASHERAMQAAERAERAEKNLGIGHCEDCAYWRRGDRPRPNWESCAWGICESPRAAGTPWGTWSCVDAAPTSMIRIMTTPRFGCVMFARKGEG